jgi:hypothetical protein
VATAAPTRKRSKAVSKAVRLQALLAASERRPLIEDLDGERWKPIPGYSMYEASTMGRIRSWVLNNLHHPGVRALRPRLLSTALTPGNEYPQVCLTPDEGRSKSQKVHGLILLTFAGPCPDERGWTASHMDGNPANNRIDNLCWELMRLNVARQFGHGTDARRRRKTERGPNEAHPLARLTADDVRAIRKARDGGQKLAALAEKYGVSEATISHIALRKTWRHVPESED